MSKKELKFSGVRSAMSQEAIRGRLESSFSRPSRGGGEVERVEYDAHTGTGKVTFLNTGGRRDMSVCLCVTDRIKYTMIIHIHVYFYIANNNL